MTRSGALGRAAAALAFACLPLTVLANDTAEKSRSSVQLNSVTGWEHARLDYDLTAVRSGNEAAPAIFLTELPDGIADIRDVQTRKRTFIRLILPLVLESNSRIQVTRGYLEQLAGQDVLFAHEQAWLDEMAADYDLDPARPDLIEALLHRVDIVPPSLAIAQSITESGWGTSRFAQKGRALYGQRTWSRGRGIVPTERGSGETYEVRAFRSLLESVRSYMRNLNTHPAYDDLRQARAEMRSAGEPIDGYRLTEGLIRYAETGEKYVEELQALIRVNRLRDFDKAELETAMDRVASLR